MRGRVVAASAGLTPASSTPLSTATPVPPGFPATFSNTVDPWTKALASLTALLLAVIGLVAVVVVLCYVLWRRVFGSPSLVVADVVNASGSADLDKVLPGLSARAREKLASALQQIRDDMRSNTEAPIPDLSLKSTPLPQSVAVDRVSALATSISAATTGDVSTIVKLLNALVAAQGTRVSTTLQRCGDVPGTLGLTFVPGELTGGNDDAPFSFWECRATPAALGGHAGAAAPAPDPAAVALTTLGDLYRNRGAYVEAKEKYEAALAKPPPYSQAQAALADVLQADWTLTARYFSLLDPAIQQLGIELARREVKRHPPSLRHRWAEYRTEAQRRRYCSQVHNYFGAQYQASGQGYGPPYASTFYKCAVADYTAAMRCDGRWYQPHENAANTYTLIGQDPAAHNPLEYYRQALDEYDAALYLIGDPPANQADSSARRTARRRVHIGKARALLLMTPYERACLAEARRTITQTRRGWDVTAERNGRVLYNLAAWYALMYGVRQRRAYQTQARRYLAYAVAREQALLEWAGDDPDFAAVVEGYGRFRSRMQLALLETSDLPSRDSIPFEWAIGEVLREAQWV